MGIIDKLQHMSVSAAITIAVIVVLRGYCYIGWRHIIWSVLLLFIPISVTKEYLDSLQPSNFFDVLDIIANYLGAGITLHIVHNRWTMISTTLPYMGFNTTHEE